MFLGSVIYDKRRSLNLTQNDLADGLCNQNTISKMEKHNMTPQIDVLIKICQRLDLSLNDVFSDFSSDVKLEQTFILDEIEEDVLLNNLHEVEEKLALVKNSINAKDMAQYDFIQAVLAFQNQEYEMSSFNLDKVIRETKADNDNIYTLTSYLFKGMIYSKQEHLDMAAYYFRIVSDSLSENLNVANATGIEIIYLCKVLGKSYLDIDDKKAAIAISQRGIEYANSNHQSYFVDELNYNIALASQNNSKKMERYKYIAYYCADLLGHKKLQKEIAQKFNS